MQQTTLLLKYNLPLRLCYRLVIVFLGGGVGSTGKPHWQRSWKLDLTTDFWLCAGIISAWPLVCVFVAIYGPSWLKIETWWCSWYHCGRGRGHGWWNVCLMSGGCGREDGRWRQIDHNHVSTSVAVSVWKMEKEKYCNVSGVVRWQRKHSRWLKSMFHWRRPWEWWQPIKTNRPLSCLFVCDSVWCKRAWLIFLISCFSHEGGI